MEDFVRWADLSELPRLRALMDGYDWRLQPGDLLRAPHHRHLPELHRTACGEYYTPDWLADVICDTLIDDEFISEQLKRYGAVREPLCVLDPACGSGTFLYHAARRILQSMPVRSSGMERREVERFVCSMIRGIDSCPAAVEMSRANLRRLLPHVAESEIAAYRGDPLLLPRPGDDAAAPAPASLSISKMSSGAAPPAG